MTHRDVINLWPSQQALASFLGISRQAVSKMAAEDRIPAYWWCQIVEAKPEVDIRELAEHVRSDMK